MFFGLTTPTRVRRQVSSVRVGTAEVAAVSRVRVTEIGPHPPAALVVAQIRIHAANTLRNGH